MIIVVVAPRKDTLTPDPSPRRRGEENAGRADILVCCVCFVCRFRGCQTGMSGLLGEEIASSRQRALELRRFSFAPRNDVPHPRPLSQEERGGKCRWSRHSCLSIQRDARQECLAYWVRRLLRRGGGLWKCGDFRSLLAMTSLTPDPSPKRRGEENAGGADILVCRFSGMPDRSVWPTGIKRK